MTRSAVAHSKTAVGLYASGMPSTAVAQRSPRSAPQRAAGAIRRKPLGSSVTGAVVFWRNSYRQALASTANADAPT